MKIIEVTEEQFIYFSNRLTPMQRGVGLPSRSFVLWAVNAIVVVKGEFQGIEEFPPQYKNSEEMTLTGLQNFVLHGNIKGVTA